MQATTKLKNRIQDQIEKISGGSVTNVAPSERKASLYGGGALVAYGLSRFSLGGVFLAVLGGLFMKRGLTGHCELYDSLGVNRAR